MVETVPPEEFRVNDDHHSCDLTDARFVAHTRRVAASDLLAQGYDPEIIEEAQDSNIDRDWNDYHADTDDDSQKQIVITEAYMRADINDDGISELVCITVVGEHTPSDILDISEISEIPFCGDERHREATQLLRRVSVRQAEANPRSQNGDPALDDGQLLPVHQPTKGGNRGTSEPR